MGLTRLAIRRPLTVFMIIMMIVVLGVRSYMMLQVDRYPKTDLPYVSVITVFGGASATDLEDQVTKPIEDAVSGVSGIDQLTSQSSDNLSMVTIQFVDGTDANQAATDVERQLATIRSTLPSDANEPIVIKADINATPIVRLVLSGPQGQDELAQFAKDNIKPELQSITGVASVNVSGGRDREMDVEPDPAKLEAYGLPIQAIQQALALNNVTVPAGDMDQGRRVNSVRAVTAYQSVSSLQNMVIVGSQGTGPLPGQNIGGIVRLGDLASVHEGYADQTRILRYNGVDAVAISVIKTGDANTIQVADQVREGVASLTSRLPAGAQLTFVTDDSKFTRASVNSVQVDLVLAILITGLIMLAFLHSFRSTLIILLAIPTSIISTCLVMWAMGFSLNMVTLMALTLVIGILVDDSIVVLENTERHLKLGKNRVQAAIDGRSEIGMAAIAITLVDVVVYLPVAFTAGIVGQFLRSYGLTIASASLFSLMVSFTLTPMLASRWMKEERGEPEQAGKRKGFLSALTAPLGWLWHGFMRVWEAAFDGLARVYSRIIHWSLKNAFTQILVLLIATASLAAGVYLAASGAVGSELLPSEDDGHIAIALEMPAGTNLATTDLAVRQIEDTIRKRVPEAQQVLSEVGATSSGLNTGTSSKNTATITLELGDKNARQRSVDAVMADLRQALASIPEAKATISGTPALGLGQGSTGTITVQISGPDSNELITLAKQAEKVIGQVRGAGTVLNTDAVQSNETRLVADPELAADQGVSAGVVASTLRTALSGTEVGKFKQEGKSDISVVLRMAPDVRQDLDQLLQMPVGYLSGQKVSLQHVSQVSNTLAPARISRANRQRIVTLRTSAAGRPDADVTNDIDAALQSQIKFPQGYKYEFVGIASIQREAFATLYFALAMSILLVYMLLVALYESWMHPLAILFSLPVSVVGAFGGLLVTGRTLNMISLLGMLLLAGVVAKNAILIVDFTNQLREEKGLSRKEALAQAGALRLRPILMTSFALIFSLLPMLLDSGAGSATRGPMAAVVIGGSVTSTLLSLILVPVAYNLLDGLAGGVRRLFRRRPAARPAAEDQAAGTGPA